MHLPKLRLASLGVLGALTACHSSQTSAIHRDAPPQASANPAGGSLVDAAAVSGALSLLARGSNALGFDVYAAARRDHPNLAISPLSISMALTMTWAGARGDTAAQMKSVLRAEGPVASTLDAERTLLAWVHDPAQTVTLRVANRLFGEKSYAFAPAYREQTSAAFGAGLEPLDFVRAPDESRRSINRWIETQTDDHIKELIPRDGVTTDTRLVLANAVYFLGLWAHAFRTDDTKPAPFHASSASAHDVPTMHETENLLFAHTDGVRVLQVPYKGGQLAMAFVLPDVVDGLDAVESRLSSATVTSWLGALTQAHVQVALPRFKVAPTEALTLRNTLAALGMPLAFDREKADFTGIASAPSPDTRLYVGAVFHEAFVKVDENGTEAAAATGVSLMKPTSVRIEPPPQEFIADHPFLFVLREIGSGMILFMGRVGDPSG